ncbi:MAG: glycerophosphodiester phosphodiesterase family protein [Steroidobacteraceae bacterium]
MTIVIAHRGASGYLPEHTLAAYMLAVQQGADYIEPDLVSTKDHRLVARHENEISGTTDVAEHREFAARRTSKRIDGLQVEGWFTEDFTLAELKTLRVRERLPNLRPQNARFDGQFQIPTFDEILALVEAMNTMRRAGSPDATPIGIYPETKHPSYFAACGLALEEPLLESLLKSGYRGARAPVFIQSFEVENLQRMNRQTRIRTVQLIQASGQPYDFMVHEDPRDYAALLTPAGLTELARHADAIGVPKSLVIQPVTGEATGLVAAAHAAHLHVHVWTFRAENEFLAPRFRRGDAPGALGDIEAELRAFLALGIDGLFADQPDYALRLIQSLPLPN